MLQNIKIRFGVDAEYSRDWLENNFQASQKILEKHKGQYPLCMCKAEGIPLYIAKRHIYYLARMPKSGQNHAAYCPSYQSCAEDSGVQCYNDHALKVNSNGTITIHLDATLSKIESHRESGASMSDQESATENLNSNTAEDKLDKMSVKGLLDLIWDSAEFTRWSPNMEKKRSWNVLKKFINEACSNIIINRRAISDKLYIPEQFNPEHIEENERTRKHRFDAIMSKSGKRTNSMFVLGSIREVHTGEFGVSIRLKHLGNHVVFWLGKNASKQYNEKYHGIVSEAIAGNELLPICLLLVRRDQDNALVVEEMGCMLTNKRLLPISDQYEKQLVDVLINEKRYFTKQLDYDATPDDIHPEVLLVDAGVDPVALDIYRPYASEIDISRRHKKREGYKERHIRYWEWDIEKVGTNVPALPQRHVFRESA